MQEEEDEEPGTSFPVCARRWRKNSKRTQTGFSELHLSHPTFRISDRNDMYMCMGKTLCLQWRRFSRQKASSSTWAWWSSGKPYLSGEHRGSIGSESTPFILRRPITGAGCAREINKAPSCSYTNFSHHPWPIWTLKLKILEIWLGFQVLKAAASQQVGRGFDSRPRTSLCGLSIFYLCLFGFSPGSPTSFQSENMHVRDSKFSLGVNVSGCFHVALQWTSDRLIQGVTLHLSQ